MSLRQYKQALKLKATFEIINGNVYGKVGNYEVSLSSKGDNCTCLFKSAFGVDGGDCKHIIKLKYILMKYLEVIYKKGDKRSA